jgi:hypothetical protein
MVNRFVNWVFRRPSEELDIPVCPDHKVEMRLRGAIGRPARFNYQTEEEYTFIYFCQVEGCNQTAEVKRSKSQVPVPNEAPARPVYARQTKRTL